MGNIVIIPVYIKQDVPDNYVRWEILSLYLYTLNKMSQTTIYDGKCLPINEPIKSSKRGQEMCFRRANITLNCKKVSYALSPDFSLKCANIKLSNN